MDFPLKTSSEKILILSAGRGMGLDGFHKLKLVIPNTGETILDRYARQFGSNIDVVVGYRAAELMSSYPSLIYNYNYSWFETASAYSAFIGMKTAPVIILPSDLIIEDESAKKINNSTGNVVFVKSSENRSDDSVNVAEKNGKISKIYRGPKGSGNDWEFGGIIKISDDQLLSNLSNYCERNPALFFVECIEKFKELFTVINLDHGVFEINSIDDYLKIFQKKEIQ